MEIIDFHYKKVLRKGEKEAEKRLIKIYDQLIDFYSYVRYSVLIIAKYKKDLELAGQKISRQVLLYFIAKYAKTPAYICKVGNLYDIIYLTLQVLVGAKIELLKAVENIATLIKTPSSTYYNSMYTYNGVLCTLSQNVERLRFGRVNGVPLHLQGLKTYLDFTLT